MRATSSLVVSALAAFFAVTVWYASARADGSSQPYGGGGRTFPQTNSIISQYNKTGELFRIEGNCRSSCTQLLAIKNVCVDPNANLEFHAAILSPSMPVNPAHNRTMASYYNAKLRSFVLANHYMDSWEFHSISGQDIIRKFGYRQCPGR